MPEGKSISVAPGEYPQLDGLPTGSKVKLSIEATLQGEEGEGLSLVFDKVEIETDGQADLQLKQMTRQETPVGPASGAEDM